MIAAPLDTVEIEPSGPTTASIIWLHGLGADAHDFEPIVPYLGIPAELGLRFVFPNAPLRPVTLNGGLRMSAWYDIFSLEINQYEDSDGIRESAQLIAVLIERERSRGIASDRILLAGFSQGGAMVLHTGLRHLLPLGGILALSCYLPLTATLLDERHSANQAVPIFMAHGYNDEILPIELGQNSRDHLSALGYQVKWHEYPMGHEVHPEEIDAIGAWLRQRLQSN